MRPNISMELSAEVYDELMDLARTLEYPPEAALSYAVRLVHACMREGLLDDTPGAPWPEEAGRPEKTGTQGRVLDFPGHKNAD